MLKSGILAAPLLFMAFMEDPVVQTISTSKCFDHILLRGRWKSGIDWHKLTPRKDSLDVIDLAAKAQILHIHTADNAILSDRFACKQHE